LCPLTDRQTDRAITLPLAAYVHPQDNKDIIDDINDNITDIIIDIIIDNIMISALMIQLRRMLH